MPAQRAIADLLLTPSLLGEVRITPSPGRKPIPAAQRIVLRRETPTAG
ncbi:hypothetical protein ABT124_03200 [Streptomyces sp. NPDC001982]